MLHNKGKRGGVKKAGWAKGAKGAGGTREPGLFGGKHYWILSQFLGDYAREVYGRELVGKVPMSQKGIALALRELEREHVLRSASKGKLLLYRLNLENSEMRDYLTQAEITRKVMFLKRHRSFAHTFRDDDRIVGIFGSYAKGAETSGSDVDLFIIGRKREKDDETFGRFMEAEVNPVYFAPKEFNRLLSQKAVLCSQIVSHHVLMFGMVQFVRAAWVHYYGLAEVVL